jgi:hypothetical protein
MGGKCPPLVHQWKYSPRNQNRPGAPQKSSLQHAIPATHEGKPPAAHEGGGQHGTAGSAGTTFAEVVVDSSLNGLATAVPAVAEELSASAVKFGVLMSLAKLRPPPVVAKPSNSRQTPFKLVQVIFMFFPLWTDGEWYSFSTGCTESEDYSFCNESDSCRDLH